MLFAHFLFEGAAIGAGDFGGVRLMGDYANRVQCAVILITAMILALTDSTFDAGVCTGSALAIIHHFNTPPFHGVGVVLPIFHLLCRGAIKLRGDRGELTAVILEITLEKNISFQIREHNGTNQTV